MYTISHDYYAILGVAKNATIEEIKEQYKKLIKAHHPDQYKGLRAKYQEEGDEDLLRVLDEKIRQEEEFCKLLNEAFEVLADPDKRKQYDEQVYEPSVEVPEIVVSPKTISFGTLTEGQKKSAVFTIENKGGPAGSVNIDWEGEKPDWGELVIEPDPNTTFPVKVTVKIDTAGIPSGPKYEKIQIVVDGEAHLIEIYLVVVTVQAATATVSSISPRMTASPTLKASRTISLGVMGIIGLGCVGLFFLTIVVSAVQGRERRIQEAEQAREVTEFVSLARGEQLIEVERIRSASDEESGCSGTECGFTFGQYEFTNVSNDLDLFIRGSWSDCIALQYGSERLAPGERVSVFCADGNFPPHWGPPSVNVNLYEFGFPGLGPWAVIGLDGKTYEFHED